MDKGKFLRDAIFYLAGFGVLVAAGFYGELSLVFSIIFLSLYTVFVIIVFIQEKTGKKKIVQNSRGESVVVNDDDDEDYIEEDIEVDDDDEQAPENEENLLEKEEGEKGLKAAATKIQVDDSFADSQDSSTSEGKLKPPKREVESFHTVMHDSTGETKEDFFSSVDLDSSNKSTSVKKQSGLRKTMRKTRSKFVWSMVKMRRRVG